MGRGRLSSGTWPADSPGAAASRRLAASGSCVATVGRGDYERGAPEPGDGAGRGRGRGEGGAGLLRRRRSSTGRAEWESWPALARSTLQLRPSQPPAGPLRSGARSSSMGAARDAGWVAVGLVLGAGACCCIYWLTQGSRRGGRGRRPRPSRSAEGVTNISCGNIPNAEQIKKLLYLLKSTEDPVLLEKALATLGNNTSFRLTNF
ncbi:uncharacterized protein RHO17_008662 [Thomomys bottae]